MTAGIAGVDRVAIIGLGLIGGSIGKGLLGAAIGKGLRRWVKIATGVKAQKISVAAFDTDAANLQAGVATGAADQAYSNLAEALASADMLVLAVPVGTVPRVLAAVKALLDEAREKARQGQQTLINPDLVITDTGSVKSSVVQAARELFGEVPPNLVPSHPIAGSEQHGVMAARADLFDGQKVILTPAANATPEAVGKVERLWEFLGARVERMPAERHDEFLAKTSHLPHLLAYTLVDAITEAGANTEVFQYSAGGFRDFTRIAAAEPGMWRDIFAANRQQLLQALDGYTARLDELRNLIESGDESGLHRILERSSTARQQLNPGHQDTRLDSRQ